MDYFPEINPLFWKMESIVFLLSILLLFFMHQCTVFFWLRSSLYMDTCVKCHLAVEVLLGMLADQVVFCLFACFLKAFYVRGWIYMKSQLT